MPRQDSGTVARIEEAAIALFSGRWYASVSIAEICRRAGLSNGVFYRYFPNKDALVHRLLEDVIGRIGAGLESVSGESADARVRSVADVIARFSAESPDLLAVFQEGQYRYYEYERRLSGMLRRALADAAGKAVGVPEYLVAVGGLRFAVARAALRGSNVSVGAIADMSARGLFPGLRWDGGKVFDIDIKPPAAATGESSRERLMGAGKRLFGERGFHAVNIHEITDAADLSVGAFYKYFDGKDSFFREQISSAGREVRRFIASNMTTGLNRLEAEMQGIHLFGTYLTIDPWCYNIVREGEFVSPATVDEYYDAFRRGYLKRGDAGMDTKSRRADPAYLDSAVEYLMGVSHYYGMEAAFDGSRSNARAVVERVGDYLAKGFLGA